ncbi:pre-RNA processing PIH1/Nop17-domain-containing protein [Mycena maculata]|uniref:Pre-RNA processing PIH1/Nop17-domain-containing protein n=1 Tax=Mycena maculata TaxID=230809 RepID=A0AAD7I969_9AGAR|nr:pre-RNA processing PIH1/Nop17-domain-containing protein [Mycena maculata]
MSRVPVQLNPVAAFCIKSSTVQSGVLSIAPPARHGPNFLEPQRASIAVRQGLKVFVNIAWDPNVPPPPEGNEEAIQRAMRGEDDTHPNPDAWFVPVVVSDAKQDTDKAGNPSLVFDCVYHTSIKSRSVRDPIFKTFIQELALQRIEAQTTLVLSRQISTPNIASKGKLLPRTVLIPASFLSQSPSGALKKPLIEEIERLPAPPAAADVSVPAKGKGILKATTAASPTLNAETAPPRPTWRWAKTPSGSIEITITIPSLTHALVARTTLDLEARRLLLAVPSHPPLDINLGVSDAEIVATSGGGDAALMLKRERALDVDKAMAEWRIGQDVLVLIA